MREVGLGGAAIVDIISSAVKITMRVK